MIDNDEFEVDFCNKVFLYNFGPQCQLSRGQNRIGYHVTNLSTTNSVSKRRWIQPHEKFQSTNINYKDVRLLYCEINLKSVLQSLQLVILGKSNTPEYSILQFVLRSELPACFYRLSESRTDDDANRCFFVFIQSILLGEKRAYLAYTKSLFN